jgi:hypothetical protein
MYGALISVVVNSLILKYVLENEDEKCECALTFEHNFIKYFSAIVIFMAFVSILFKDEMMKAILSSKNGPKIFMAVYGLLSLVYSIILLVHFFKLRQSCKCSEDAKQYVMLYPLLVVVLVTISFLLMINVKK